MFLVLLTPVYILDRLFYFLLPLVSSFISPLNAISKVSSLLIFKADILFNFPIQFIDEVLVPVDLSIHLYQLHFRQILSVCPMIKHIFLDC